MLALAQAADSGCYACRVVDGTRLQDEARGSVLREGIAALP